MSVQDAMLKTSQLAKNQLGMSREQAFCEHDWEPTYMDRRSDQITERKCTKCQLRQRSKLVWCDVKDPN